MNVINEGVMTLSEMTQFYWELSCFVYLMVEGDKLVSNSAHKNYGIFSIFKIEILGKYFHNLDKEH